MKIARRSTLMAGLVALTLPMQGCAQTGQQTAAGLCGPLDQAVADYAPSLGFTVSGTDHEEFLPDDVFCRWVAPNGLDFMKVQYTFDDFAYTRSQGEYTPYAAVPGALVMGDAVIVMTPGGWSIEVAPIPNADFLVDPAGRDRLLQAAVQGGESPESFGPGPGSP